MAVQRAIRVGFIGLNASEGWAINSHLPYFKSTGGSQQYRINALLNSSEESAKAAIASHGLETGTKAYGSAERFAEDSDIDLVICSVRVDRHYPILKPILQKTSAKAVFCEWPLGSNLKEAQELTELARKRGITTIVGLQGRVAPTSQVVKKLLDEGKIGRPLSVTVTASGYNFGVADLHSLAYSSDINIGGNMMTIHFSHSLDTITQAVGQLKSYSATLDTQRKKTLLRNKPHTYKPGPNDEPVKIIGEVERTSHDQILVQGHLENGATFSFHMRGGMAFPDTPALEWRIYGENGEIRVTTSGVNLHFGGPGHRIQLHSHGSEKAEDVEIPQDEFDKAELPWPAKGPSRVYEAFAKGESGVYADWEEAVKRHRLVEELYAINRKESETKATYMQG